MAINITKYTRYVPWDGLGIGASRRSASGGAVTIDLSQYYTISQLQTIGQSEILFDNLIEAYHNKMLGLQGGKVIIDSSGTPSEEGDDEFYHLDEETYSRVITWEFVDSLIEESDGTIHLVNDEDNPGILKYYGTDISGIKGWFDLPEESSSGGGGVSNYIFDMSLVEDSSGVVTLLNDIETPGNNYYYGTDESGTKGWFDLPSVTGFVNVSGTPVDNQIAIWVDEDTIEGSTELSYDGRTFVFGGYPIDVPDVAHTMISIGAILNDYVNATYCVFIGLEAGVATTTGKENTAIGYAAFYSNTRGSGNLAIGYQSLFENISGYENTAIGYQSLYKNTDGDYNLAIGFRSLYHNIGLSNTAIGYAALMNNTTGSYNIAIGNDTGNRTKDNTSNETSKNSIYIGKSINPLASGDINEIIIGYEAQGAGSNTTVIGNYDTIGTYLAGEIYFITYSESSGGSDTTGSLPLADSDITQVVMYDPTTGKLYYGAGEGGGGTEYSFAMSLSESAGTVSLDNDEASPGNSKYYGTNGSGTKGWYDLPSGGGSAVDSTLLDWSTDRYQPYTTQQSGGEFYTDQNTIPDEVDYLGYNGTLGVRSLYSVIGLDVGLSTSGIASTSWHVNMFGLTETYLASDVRCRFNPAVESYLGYDAYMFDTGGTLASDQWLSVWKHDGDIVASLDGDGKLYSNTFIYKYAIGDSSLISHYPEQTTTSESYTKLKTITLGSNIGINTILRIRFDLKLDPVGSPPWAYGRIYRNGIAVGTERETGSSSYITYSEDITDWNAGDTVELWVRTYNSGYTAYVRDFTICGSHNSIANEVTGTTS